VELRDLYRTYSIVKLVGWVCSSDGEEKCVRNFGEEIAQKAANWKIREGDRDNIKMDLREIVCEGGKWMKLAQDFVQWLAFVLLV
jgi:hypothetical protein